MDIYDSGGYRNEEKYLFPLQAKALIETKLKMFAALDKHVKNGIYNVRSIYFDDFFNSAMKDNEDGYDPRSKWRIRAYNCDLDRLTLERKSKVNGLTKKDSEIISYQDYQTCVERHAGINKEFESPIYQADSLLNLFLLDMNLYGLSPKVIVDYDRVPYVYNINTVRITIDYNIACIDNCCDFANPNVQKHPILEANQGIMEVKYNGTLPDFIAHIVREFGMQRTANSKYYLCRLSKMERRGI